MSFEFHAPLRTYRALFDSLEGHEVRIIYDDEDEHGRQNVQGEVGRTTRSALELLIESDYAADPESGDRSEVMIKYTDIEELNVVV